MTGGKAPGAPKPSPWMWQAAETVANMLSLSDSHDFDGHAADAMVDTANGLRDALLRGLPDDHREAAVLCLMVAEALEPLRVAALDGRTLDSDTVANTCGRAITGIIRAAYAVAPADPAGRRVFDRLAAVFEAPELAGARAVGIDYQTGVVTRSPCSPQDTGGQGDE